MKIDQLGRMRVENPGADGQRLAGVAGGRRARAEKLTGDDLPNIRLGDGKLHTFRLFYNIS